MGSFPPISQFVFGGTFSAESIEFDDYTPPWVANAMNKFSPSGTEYMTLVLEAANHCETIGFALRCLRHVLDSRKIELRDREYLQMHARVRIAGHLSVLSNRMNEAVERRRISTRNCAQEIDLIRELACLDQLLAAQRTLLIEMSRLS